MNDSIPEKLLKPYDSQSTEARIYKAWEESGFFNPDICIEKGVANPKNEHFSIVLPPPNVTGILHLGSSLMVTIEDIIVRKNRMEGRPTLWIPGTDHAAIATQAVVEKKLEKEEGKKKQDLGREEFLKRVNDYALESQKTIISQLKGLGGSLDWSRQAFTLDENRSLAVRTAFKKMYEDGLIYRGHRVINWDTKAQTTISDDEIVYEERDAILYTFTYSKDFPIPISTTRPETKFGDTAVAVHPEDERYQQYIGKEYDVDFLGEKLHIKIIADHSVEKEFGTGALGVTPAHSMIDYEIAMRHQLPIKQIIDEFGKMQVGPDGVLGKKTIEARVKTAELLKAAGLITTGEPVKQNVSTSERTGAIIEPLPKLQWFINVNKPVKERAGKTLKELMLETPVEFVPDRFKNIYTKWIENLRDWCISRQIWYGHQIPVWYKKDNPAEIYVGIEAPENTGVHNEWVQDEDTLDTWFSSGLWTFSTLGWPNESADFKTYHPTTLLETGSDIIFFWVARMILMSTYLLGEIPFKTAYLHGLVRDEKGCKISKSLGNNIDPLDMGAKYGTDALRMSLIIGNQPGNDSRFSEDKIRAYKNFANKLWNITRFVLTNTADFEPTSKSELNESEQKIIKDLEEITSEITKDIDAYRLHLAGEKLYHYIWHTFADIILEDCKKAIVENSDRKQSSQRILISILYTSLKLLHPFMPFITEEIWQLLPTHFKKTTDNELLMVSSWPK